jgi:hypothetical protein
MRNSVIDENDLVQLRPLGFGFDLGARLYDGVDHSGGTLLTFRGCLPQYSLPACSETGAPDGLGVLFR